MVAQRTVSRRHSETTRQTIQWNEGFMYSIFPNLPHILLFPPEARSLTEASPSVQ